MAPELLASKCQRRPSFVAHEQGAAKESFQTLYACADRGLRDVQTISRRAEAAGLDYGEKRTCEFGVHRETACSGAKIVLNDRILNIKIYCLMNSI
jgi:hypothetical protein